MAIEVQPGRTASADALPDQPLDSKKGDEKLVNGPNRTCALRDRRLAMTAADGLVKAIRQASEFRIEDEQVAENPTDKGSATNQSTESRHTWTVGEARKFKARHPVASTSPAAG